ncbi:MAG: hypothetical protein K2X53_04015, partial [Alphaproteobacteria bacterium]|nr:hypothetical protein [Alphaproteobacteria bacterium]
MFNKILIYSSFFATLLMGADSCRASVFVMDEEKSDRNAALLNLVSYCNHYRGYEEDYENFALNYNEEQRAIGGNYNIIDIAASDLNRKIADRYGQEILNVMCDHSTLNSFIHGLLTERLERLKLRSSDKEKMFKTQAEFRKYPEKFENVRYEKVAHTHPSMIEKHYSNDPVMRRQARGDTTFYQFVNSLILGLYKIAEPKELSEKTRLLIRASACLHGLLKGETDDLGHPDEAIYQDASDPKGKLFDLDLYETHILKSELVDMPLLGYSRGETIKIYMTQYDRSQEDRSYYYKGILPLPYPEWLVPKGGSVSAPQRSTSYAAGATTSDKQPVLTGSMKSKLSESTILSPIDQNSSRVKNELSQSSYQETLKANKDIGGDDVIGSIPASSAVSSDKKAESTMQDDKDNEVKDEIENMPASSVALIPDVKSENTTVEQVIEGMSSLEIHETSDNIPSWKSKKIVPNKKPHSIPSCSSDQGSSSSDQVRLAPRGLRLFHAHQKQPFETLKNREDLAGTHAKTLISIH